MTPQQAIEMYLQLMSYRSQIKPCESGLILYSGSVESRMTTPIGVASAPSVIHIRDQDISTSSKRTFANSRVFTGKKCKNVDRTPDKDSTEQLPSHQHVLTSFYYIKVN